MRVAVVTWDGGSNREPFELLCRALVDRGDTVEVISHEVHRGLYEQLGAAFTPLPVGDKDHGDRPSAEDERARVLGVWLSPKIAHLVRGRLREEPRDVAVADVSLMTAFCACEATSTPFVVMHHTLPGATWGGPRRATFESFVEPVNELRRTLQLPTVADFGALMRSAAAHVVPTARALDATVPWTLPLHYVGPLQPFRPDADLPELPGRFVLMSFSTTWQRQIPAMQDAIDALAPLDRPVVVTCGPSVDPSELRAAGNTVVIGHVPHQQLFDRVDAVVTHAGHGTVVSALRAGVPLVCVPMGRDQHDISRRVVAVGAGLEVDRDALDRQLLPELRRVLEDASFRVAAKEMARSISGHGGVGEALAVVDNAVASG